MVKNKIYKKRDFHMHAQITRDAAFAEEFILQAIKLGFEEICITDHCPIPFDHAADRIIKGNIDRYMKSVRDAAERYKDDIVIRPGLEVDYFPEYEDYICDMLRDREFDFILASSHIHIAGYGFDFNAHKPDCIVKRSLKNTLEAVKSGFFTTVAHLDMYKWYFNDTRLFPKYDEDYHIDEHRELILQIFSQMKLRGMLLEINSAGLRKAFCEQYPQSRILKWSESFGLGYVFGSDAHRPEQVGYGYDILRKSFPALNCF